MKKIDKNYDLKGAARPARDFYVDPNYQPEPEPINLFDLYSNSIWEHLEGQIYLKMLLEYGIALHNVAQKTKEAIKTFEKILSFDPSDHLVRRVKQTNKFIFSFFSTHFLFNFSLQDVLFFVVISILVRHKKLEI